MDLQPECPLCLEELDWDDKRFFPCTCSYQICRFCWHHLKSSSTDDCRPPSCPACRKPYGDTPAKYKPIPMKKKAEGSQSGSQMNKAGQSARVSPGQAASGIKGGQPGGQGNQGQVARVSQGHGDQGGRANQVQGNSGAGAKQSEMGQGARANHIQGSQGARINKGRVIPGIQVVGQPTGDLIDKTKRWPQGEIQKRELIDVRVIQKNLILVVGLSPSMAKDKVLRQKEFFGNFGKIINVDVNRPREPTSMASAYITFSRTEDALRSLTTKSDRLFGSRTIKANLGTNKYCSFYIRNQACPQEECMYLHTQQDAESSFTKEEMAAGKHKDYELKLLEAFKASQVPKPVSERSLMPWKTVTVVQPKPEAQAELSSFQQSKLVCKPEPTAISAPGPVNKPEPSAISTHEPVNKPERSAILVPESVQKPETKAGTILEPLQIAIPETKLTPLYDPAQLKNPEQPKTMYVSAQPVDAHEIFPVEPVRAPHPLSDFNPVFVPYAYVAVPYANYNPFYTTNLEPPEAIQPNGFYGPGYQLGRTSKFDPFGTTEKAFEELVLWEAEQGNKIKLEEDGGERKLEDP